MYVKHFGKKNEVLYMYYFAVIFRDAFSVRFSTENLNWLCGWLYILGSCFPFIIFVSQRFGL